MIKHNISDQTKKMLFAKSGNLCALCKSKGQNTLLVDANNTMNVNIAHIVSRNAQDVRYEKDYEKVNDEENLILLCQKCHGEIDRYHADQYSIEFLRQLKKQHEEYFIKKSLNISDIYDVTENSAKCAKYPKSLKNVWADVEEDHYRQNIDDALKDYKMVIDNLKILPADCRTLLRICIERGEEHGYSGYKVPVSEIEQVINCSKQDIKELYNICHKYGFIDYDKEEGVGYFYITDTTKNSTPVFLEIKEFAINKKISLKKFFDELDFSILDK